LAYFCSLFFCGTVCSLLEHKDYLHLFSQSSHFWRSECKMGLARPNQGISRTVILPEVWEVNLPPCLMKLLGSFLGSWPSSIFKASNSQWITLRYTLTPHHLSQTLLPPSFTHKDPCDYFGPIQIIQIDLPSQDPNFITSTKSFLPNKITFTDSRWCEMDILRRLLSCLTQKLFINFNHYKNSLYLPFLSFTCLSDKEARRLTLRQNTLAMPGCLEPVTSSPSASFLIWNTRLTLNCNRKWQ
jgi:hypothetical protein